MVVRGNYGTTITFILGRAIYGEKIIYRFNANFFPPAFAFSLCPSAFSDHEGIQALVLHGRNTDYGNRSFPYSHCNAVPHWPHCSGEGPYLQDENDKHGECDA